MSPHSSAEQPYDTLAAFLQVSGFMVQGQGIATQLIMRPGQQGRILYSLHHEIINESISLKLVKLGFPVSPSINQSHSHRRGSIDAPSGTDISDMKLNFDDCNRLGSGGDSC